MEIKVQREKGKEQFYEKSEIKVQREKGNKSPKRKGKLTSKEKIKELRKKRE